MDYNLSTEQFEGYKSKSVTDQVLGYNNILDLMGDIKGKKILDYGCGSGDFSMQLAGLGANVLGADLSANMIDVANEKRGENFADNLSYVVVENNQLPLLAENSFDFAVMNFVICTISELSNIEQIFKEIFRLLKPGGRLLILTVNWEKSNGREFISFKLDNVSDLRPGDSVWSILKWDDNLRVRDYFWSQNNYHHFFEKAGFSDIKIREILAVGKEYSWIDEDQYSPFFIAWGQK